MRLEAQAIVLAAGPGMRMTTLTNHNPKCLLALGTLPMVCYPLHLLQEAGFLEATVVVSSGAEQRMRKLVEQYDLKLNLDITTVNTADDPGTADSLRHISAKIKHNVDDVVIITSDLVSDVKLQSILNQHRARGAALTMLTANQHVDFLKATPPGPKSKPALSSDVICTESETGRLMFAVAGGDYDEVLSLSGRVLSNAKSLDVSTSLTDSHLYIMKRWVIEYILSKESPCGEMGSLKDEIIPHLISSQFSSPPTKERNTRKLDIHDVIENEEYDDLVTKYNSSVVLSRHHSSKPVDSRVCYIYHHPGLCVRANNLNCYWELNRKMHSLFSEVCPNSTWSTRHPSADVHEKAQVSPDTLIGAGSVICEKTNVSSTVVGNHCRINSFADAQVLPRRQYPKSYGTSCPILHVNLRPVSGQGMTLDDHSHSKRHRGHQKLAGASEGRVTDWHISGRGNTGTVFRCRYSDCAVGDRCNVIARLRSGREGLPVVCSSSTRNRPVIVA